MSRSFFQLEPRLLFDASAVDTADHVHDDGAHADFPGLAFVHEDTGNHNGYVAENMDQSGLEAAEESVSRVEIFVMDASVQNPAEIEKALGQDAVILRLDAETDGITALSEALVGYDNIDALHIFSHGSDGQVHLGSAILDDKALAERGGQISGWADAFSADGDIVLYGCNVAATQAGQAFAVRLADLTRTDVAASTDPTGSADKGGDWDMGFKNGPIETKIVSVAAYDRLLEAPHITGVESLVRVGVEDTDKLVQWARVDSSAETIHMAITASHGTLHLQTTAGLEFDSPDHGNGKSELRFSGTRDAINMALLGHTNNSGGGNENSMIYRPTKDFNGRATLTITATDLDAEGLEGLSDTRTFQLDFSPVNDAPTSTPSNLSVNEGGTATFGADQLGLVDPDLPAGSYGGVSGNQVLSQQIVEVRSLPNKGTLTFNGNVVGVGTLFSYDQLTSLKYEHDDSDVNPGAPNTTSDSFTYIIRDGAGGNTGTETMTIKLQPINQAPTATVDATIYEGQFGSVNLKVSDKDAADLPGNTQIEITALPHRGHLFLDLNGNKKFDAGEEITAEQNNTFTAADTSRLYFMDDGSDPAADTSFTAIITDSGGGQGVGHEQTLTQTFDITVLPVNDDPTFEGTRTAEVAGAPSALIPQNPQAPGEGTVGVVPVLLTNIPAERMLNAADVDTDLENVIYCLTKMPETGVLQFNDGTWRTMQQFATFSQDDVDQGRVRFAYVGHYGSSLSTDTFEFQVRDSCKRPGFDDLGQPDGSEYEGGVRVTPDSTEPLQTLEFTFNIINPRERVLEQLPAADDTLSNNVSTAQPEPSVNTGLLPGSPGNFKYQEGGRTQITKNALEYIIKSGDVTAPAGQVMYTVTELPEHGSIIYRDGGVDRVITEFGTFTQKDINDGKIFIEHDGNEYFKNDSFKFFVSNGGQNPLDNQTFTFTADPVNDAPTAGSEEDVLVKEGGTVRITTANMGMSDVDGSGDKFNNAGEAPSYEYSQPNTLEWRIETANMPQHGTLYFDNNHSGQYDAGDTVVAADTWHTQADVAKLIYVHDGTENFSDSYTFQVRDLYGANTPTPDTEIGGLSAKQVVKIDITPVNDAPLIHGRHNEDPKTSDGDMDVNGNYIEGEVTSVNRILTISEGGTGTIDHTYLRALDPDSTTIQRQYTIGQNTRYGKITLNGKVLGAGSTFTQNHIDQGLIKYVHDGTEPTDIDPADPAARQDYFTFTVSDGSGVAVTGRFDIAVDPTNDKPEVTVPAGPITIASTDPANNKITGVTVSDPDLKDGVIPDKEKDFMQVTARLLKENGTPIDTYNGVTIKCNDTTSGVTVIKNGDNNILQIQGTLAQVNAALAGLTVTFADDRNAVYKLEIIADDRMRDDNGVLDAASGPDANGGEMN